MAAAAAELACRVVLSGGSPPAFWPNGPCGDEGVVVHWRSSLCSAHVVVGDDGSVTLEACYSDDGSSSFFVDAASAAELLSDPSARRAIEDASSRRRSDPRVSHGDSQRRAGP